MRRLACLLLLTTGCAAPSFVGQTGRVTPRQDFRVGLGVGYQVNTSAAALVEDGRDLARQLASKRVACPDLTGQDCWNVSDVRPVVRAGMRFALVAPLSVNTALSGRYGFADGLDVGLRWGPGNMGADVGWQAFGPRQAGVEGWAGSFFAGYGKRDLGTLGSVIEDVLKGDASLDDYSLTFVAGRQFRQVAHLYLGGRYIYTHWRIQVLPDLPLVYDGAASQRRLLGSDASGHVQHVGAVLGAAVGYQKVFLGAELNLVQTFGRADVLFEEVSFSGFGIMPAVYLYGQF
jgi:hypothetical protein